MQQGKTDISPSMACAGLPALRFPEKPFNPMDGFFTDPGNRQDDVLPQAMGSLRTNVCRL
jgi:hypothetical protein